MAFSVLPNSCANTQHSMKLTKIQWVTVIAILSYLIYEFIFVRNWAAGLPESDPIIRADLFLIYPVLLILIIISLLQLIRRKSSKS